MSRTMVGVEDTVVDDFYDIIQHLLSTYFMSKLYLILPTHYPIHEGPGLHEAHG